MAANGTKLCEVAELENMQLHLLPNVDLIFTA
jgi:hypothetical protein